MGIEYHWDLIQGTDEWRHARLGLITASQMGQLVTEKTLKPANNDKVRTLIYELAAQRITKQIGDNYQSYEMMRGEKEEVLAKDLYNKYYNRAKDCGFITNDSLGFKIGMSPDGLVGDDGGIEVKSRASKYQVKTIIEGEVPSEFMAQIQGFFLVTEREWCDFVSYSNGMHMFVNRVKPIVEWQDALKEAVIQSEQKINELVEEYAQKTKDLVRAEWIDVMAEYSGDIKPSDASTNYYMAG